MLGSATKLVWWVFGGVFSLCLLVGGWFVVSEIYHTESTAKPVVQFSVLPGESVRLVANRLHEERLIRHPWLFRLYLIASKRDRSIHAGEFTIEAPITAARVAAALTTSGRAAEKTITILPGWDLRDIAAYLENEGWGSAAEVYTITGQSADRRSLAINTPAWRALPMFADAPITGSLDGYLAPDTYRVFATADISSIIDKLVRERNDQIASLAAKKRGDMTWHEILTLASIVEREVRGVADRKIVADLFLRRLSVGMALQADSTVHYAVAKKGDLFTTAADRDTDSPWNTYKYPGLPPGPIATPSLSAIEAVLEPTPNDYWYFMTTLDGEVKYGRTLDEHNRNVAKFLR